jgi:hypothetical protein
MGYPLTWAAVLWLLALLFILGVIGYLVIRSERLRAENTELVEKLERATQGHTCYPPAWTSQGPNGWIRPEMLSHWVCTCGTRFVLVRSFRPRHDGPFRLGWVTDVEHARGRAPSWVRQEPQSRLDSPPPARHTRTTL